MGKTLFSHCYYIAVPENHSDMEVFYNLLEIGNQSTGLYSKWYSNYEDAERSKEFKAGGKRVIRFQGIIDPLN